MPFFPDRRWSELGFRLAVCYELVGNSFPKPKSNVKQALQRVLMEFALDHCRRCPMKLHVNPAIQSALRWTDRSSDQLTLRKLPVIGETSADRWVCVTILGGIRRAAHPSLSKWRRLLGERQELAYKHDAQASECSGTLACASCLYRDKHSSAACLTPSESTTKRSFDFTQN